MMLLLDSGLGGLSVARELRAMQPGMPLLYIADTAGFPYGARSAEEICGRATTLIEAALAKHSVSTIVLACNTLSTLCLAHLRAQYPQLTFVGTVPAVKVAAERSKSHRFTLLATPGTANSSYSKDLIARFAKGCMVDDYGAPHLAQLTEAILLGDPVSPELLRQQIAPCFHDDARGRTDSIVLGCTHYPLIIERLISLAPWAVDWIDSSPAIARQALKQYKANGEATSQAYVTTEQNIGRYAPVFAREGFGVTATLAA